MYSISRSELFIKLSSISFLIISLKSSSVIDCSKSLYESFISSKNTDCKSIFIPLELG